MIEQISGGFHLVCDICDEPHEKQFREFYDAVEAKREMGWISRKTKDKGWQDICPDCQEAKPWQK